MGGFADVLLPARATLGAPGSLALLLTLSVPFVWMFSMSLLLARTPSFPYGEQALFSLALGGALILFAFAARGGRGAAPTRPRDALAGVLLAAASLALPFFPGFSPVVCVAVFAAAGVSFAWVALRCFGLTCYVDELDGPAAVLVPFALAALIRLVFMSVPLAYAYATVVLIAVLAPLSLLSVRCFESRLGGGLDGIRPDNCRPDAGPQGGGGEAHSLRSVSPSRIPLRAFVLELGLCALVLGLFKGSVGLAWGTADSAVNYLARAFIAFLLLFAFSSQGRGGMSRTARRLVSVVLLCLLGASVLGGEQVGAAVARALFSLSRNFALVVVYLMALDLVRGSGWGAISALGFLRGMFELLQGVGVALAGAFDIDRIPALSMPGTAFLVTAFVLVVVTDQVIQLMSARADSLSGTGRPGAETDGGIPGQSPAVALSAVAPSAAAASQAADARLIGRALASVPSDELDARFAYLGWLHRLTVREADVLRLSCAGLSKSKMAERLCLSVNTVRWHSQNAYAKLGVHSVEELFSLVRDTSVPDSFKSAETYLNRNGEGAVL